MAGKAGLLSLLCLQAALANDDGSSCEEDIAVSLLQKSLQIDRPASALVAQGTEVKGAEDEEYPWSQRGRDYTQSSSTPYSAPTDFSDGPSWTWLNPDDEQVRHSPLIDNDKNIYVTTAIKMRKFNSNGTLLWTLPRKHMTAAPALYKGLIYGVSTTGPKSVVLFAVDMDAGTERFNKSIDRQQNGDASSVFVYNDTVVFAVNQEQTKGSLHNVYAAKASDGTFLWEFAPDDMLWNFSPGSPGDGSIVFAGSCGRAFRINFEGKLLWKHGPTGHSPGGTMCGTGGGAMGPNGVFYHVYNKWDRTCMTCPTGAFLTAYNVSNGAHLWTNNLSTSHRGNQYPAVGKIGKSGTLAVVVPLGDNTKGVVEKEPMPRKDWLKGAVVTFDAKTGAEIWRYDEPPWPHMLAANDDKGKERQILAAMNPGKHIESICMPDTQGIPLVAGDGTVYMSSSHSGDLRAIEDKDENGKIDESEVSTFRTDHCFLNSPSLAQGMLVAAPCFGPLYVFKDDMPGKWKQLDEEKMKGNATEKSDAKK